MLSLTQVLVAALVGGIDPIPVVSPNDVLCPVVTYVCLGILAAFRSSSLGTHWPRVRVWLTLVSFVVTSPQSNADHFGRRRTVGS